MKRVWWSLYKSSPYREIFTLVLPAVFLLVIIINCFASTGASQQFSNLAQAFLHGQLNFLHPIGGLGQDPVLYHGKIYWDEGPFPAMILTPFVGLFSLFHLFFYQGYLMWPLTIGVFYFVYKLARLFSFDLEDALILAFGFCLGSVYIGVASISSGWLFAQVVTVFLLFWSMYEFFTDRRWWLIGCICACIFMTRATATPILIFYGLELFDTVKKNKRLKTLAQLCLPLGIAICLIGLYNYLRFSSPFDGGYMYQLLHDNSAESRSLGVFSPIHIPTNFYYAVLSAPTTVVRDSTSWTLKFPYIRDNVYGMSIFFTSPYFLYFFTRPWKTFDRHFKHLMIAILVSALFVFSFYGVGALQYGYRYSLDFLPELFVLFMLVYRRGHDRITTGMKTLLLGSGIVNFFLLIGFIY